MSDLRQSQAFTTHNHDQCMKVTLADVDEICRSKSLRMTSIRKRVLEILLESHTAMGAYEVLERLAAEGLGSQPPVAYRALEFLIENGFVHKLQCLNAYIACGHPSDTHNPVFLICTGCNCVAETKSDDASHLVRDTAKKLGFVSQNSVIEVKGQCADCAEVER